MPLTCAYAFRGGFRTDAVRHASVRPGPGAVRRTDGHGRRGWERYADRPVQVTGHAGDLLLAHYLLGHNIGGNFESAQTRRALYCRISSTDHATHREEFLQDAWLDYAPVRSAAAGARPGGQ